MIDAQYEHVSNIAVKQTQQIRDLTAEHTSKGLETVKAYTGEYASVASEYIGKSRQKIPGVATNGNTTTEPKTADFPQAPKTAAFPQAPKTDLPSTAAHTEPLVTAPVDGSPIAVSAHY